MTLTFVRVLGDAWAVFRRERDVALAVALPFLFLPSLAIQLLLPPPPPLPASLQQEQAVAGWLAAFGNWAQANAPWYALAGLVALVGTAALAALLVDRSRPDVRGALGLALRLLPRLVLAAILVGVPVGLGLWLLILPGLYLQARLVAVVPLLLAERPLSAAGALARSWRVTRSAQVGLFGTTTALLILQWLALSPLSSLAHWLGDPARANPIAFAIVAAVIALAETAYRLALLFAGIVAWRRLASTGT